MRTASMTELATVVRRPRLSPTRWLHVSLRGHVAERRSNIRPFSNIWPLTSRGGMRRATESASQ
jgi:hypothetical protein